MYGNVQVMYGFYLMLKEIEDIGPSNEPLEEAFFFRIGL
jgi:hypothetical protein